MEYFWKYARSVNVETVPFSDVAKGTDFEKAVSWAVDYGITNGTGGTTFSPDQIVTRGQIVTFLYRFYVAPLDNSELIDSLRNPTPSTPSTPETPSVPAYTGPLDPLPPMDYMQQPDWYGTLTPVDNMSNARLVAEYDRLWAEMERRMDQDIYMSDGPYSRELVLYSALSQRCEIVERYDRGLKNGSLSDKTVAAYRDLVAKYGNAEYLRQSVAYG